jgi:hypothetical protein
MVLKEQKPALTGRQEVQREKQGHFRWPVSSGFEEPYQRHRAERTHSRQESLKPTQSPPPERPKVAAEQEKALFRKDFDPAVPREGPRGERKSQGLRQNVARNLLLPRKCVHHLLVKTEQSHRRRYEEVRGLPLGLPMGNKSFHLLKNRSDRIHPCVEVPAYGL